MYVRLAEIVSPYRERRTWDELPIPLWQREIHIRMVRIRTRVALGPIILDIWVLSNDLPVRVEEEDCDGCRACERGDPVAA